MTSVKDVLLRFIGQDMVSPVQNKIRRNFDSMEGSAKKFGLTSQSIGEAAAHSNALGSSIEKTTGKWKEMAGAAGMALTSMGAGMAFFLASTIPAATAAQEAWGRYAASLGMNFDQWSANKDKYIADLDNMVNRTGRSLGSLRDAEAGLSRFGVSHSQFANDKTGDIVAGIAAYKMEDMNAASESYGNALLGNQRALRDLGITFNDLGVDSKTWASMSEDARMKALNATLASKGYLQQEQNYAQTDAAKLAVLQARWEGMKAKIGAVVVNALLPIIDTASKVLDWFNKLPQPIQNTIGTIAVLGTAFALVAGPILMLIGTLPMLESGLGILAGLPMIGGAISALSGMVGILGGAFTGLAGSVVSAGSTLLIFLATNPVGWVILAAVAIVALITYFNKWGDVINGLTTIWNALQSAAGTALAYIQNGINIIGALIYAGFINYLKLARTEMDYLGAGFNFLKGIGMSVFNLLIWLGQTEYRGLQLIYGFVIGQVVNSFNFWKGVATGVWNTIMGLFNWILTQGKPIIDILTGAVNLLAGAFKTVSDFVQGGIDKIKEMLGLTGQDNKGQQPFSANTTPDQSKANPNVLNTNNPLNNKNITPEQIKTGLQNNKGLLDKNNLLFRTHSPLTLQSGNARLLTFPQLTPDFLGAVKGFGAINKNSVINNKSSSTQNISNTTQKFGSVNINIDGKDLEMSDIDLAKKMMRVFDLVAAGKVPPESSRG